MKITDIYESETSIEQVIETIKNSKWFKESTYDLLRGVRNALPDDTYKEVHISKDRERRPVDSTIQFHDFANKLSMKTLGVKIRNGLFVTPTLSQAKNYGDLVVVFPIDDDLSLYNNPSCYDFYGEIANYSDIQEYIKGVESLKISDTPPHGEVIAFGNIILLNVNTANKYGLLKNEVLDVNKLISNINNATKDSDKISNLIHTNRVAGYVISDEVQIKELIEEFYDVDPSTSNLPYLFSTLESITGTGLMGLVPYFNNNLLSAAMWRGVINVQDSLRILYNKNDLDLISRLPRSYVEELFDIVGSNKSALRYIMVMEQIMEVIDYYPKSAKKVFDLIIERKDVLDLSKFGNIITKTEQQFNIKVDDLT